MISCNCFYQSEIWIMNHDKTKFMTYRSWHTRLMTQPTWSGPDLPGPAVRAQRLGTRSYALAGPGVASPLVFIHYRNTQNLLIELFKVKNCLPPENVTDTFSQQSQTQYNSSVIWQQEVTRIQSTPNFWKKNVFYPLKRSRRPKKRYSLFLKTWNN